MTFSIRPYNLPFSSQIPVEYSLLYTMPSSLDSIQTIRALTGWEHTEFAVSPCLFFSATATKFAESKLVTVYWE